MKFSKNILYKKIATIKPSKEIFCETQTNKIETISDNINPNSINMFLTHEPITNTTNNDENLTLTDAVKNNDWNSVEKLIAGGADINAKNNNGLSPLFIAALFEDWVSVKTLIEFGADINTKNINDDSPLAFAVKNKNRKMVDELIELGADINIRCYRGATPIFFAVFNKDWELAKFLKLHGADVNAKDDLGQTLRWVCKAANEQIENDEDRIRDLNERMNHLTELGVKKDTGFQKIFRKIKEMIKTYIEIKRMFIP